MENRSVLSTLRFVFFTILALVLIFSAVLVTVLNTYKPTVKAYIGGKFVGYFSSIIFFITLVLPLPVTP